MHRMFATATATLALTGAAAYAGPQGQVTIEPVVEFYPRDLAPFDGVFDDVQGECVRSASWEYTAHCAEFSITEILSHGGFFIDVAAHASRSWPPEDPYSVVVEIYPADGVASPADAARPGLLVADFARSPEVSTLSLLTEITGIIPQFQRDGYTHLGVRFTTPTPGPYCTRADARVVVTLECPRCIFDYNRDGEWKTSEDLWAFVTDWSRGHPCTDFDRSGAVDMHDLWDWIYTFGGQHCW